MGTQHIEDWDAQGWFTFVCMYVRMYADDPDEREREKKFFYSWFFFFGTGDL